MQPYIAPQVLRVNNKPAECSCSDDGDILTVCGNCIQAGLVVYARRNEKRENVQKSRRGSEKPQAENYPST
jgi:hypothetical protein